MPDHARPGLATAPLIVIMATLVVGCGEASPPSTPPPATPAAPPPAPQAAAAPDAPATPPASSPPTATQPTGGSETDPETASFLGFTAPKPATWRSYPPENQMRAANWVVPGASGDDQAHLVVFQGIGGSNEANIARWVGQFRSADGQPVEPAVSTLEVEGVAVTIVELAGEHQRMGADWYTPDQLFLAAIVDGPLGPIHIRLVGETATVEGARADFMALIEGLRRER